MEWVKRCKLKSEMEKAMTRKQRQSSRSASSFTYDDLERGSLSAADARHFVQHLLQSGPDQEIAGDLYDSLRVLTGRILRDKSDSENLRAWYSLIDAVSAQFDELEDPWAARIEVLAELLSDRLGMLESRPAHEVLQRRHVPDLLELLDRHTGELVRRNELRDRLGLAEANLSRILTLLVDTGLIERSKQGKEALFSICSLGREVLLDHNDRIGIQVEVDGCVHDGWLAMFDLEPEIVASGGEIDEFVEHFEPDEQLPLAA